jgi:thymidylate kinase
VAVANGITQRRETRSHLRKGRVVICDRYSLDSAVHLRYRYGEHRRFRLQAALVRVLSPRPVRAFLLDVPAETGLARKAEQYDLGQLARQVRLYREEHEQLGVRRLDGERPREELCAEIAREVWLAL